MCREEKVGRALAGEAGVFGTRFLGAGIFGTGIRKTEVGTTCTAVFGEKHHESAKVFRAKAVNNGASVALGADQFGVRQFLEVKGESVLRNVELSGDVSSAQTVFAGLYQHAKNTKPHLLSERRQNGDSFIYFHSSRTLELFGINQVTEWGITVEISSHFGVT